MIPFMPPHSAYQHLGVLHDTHQNFRSARAKLSGILDNVLTKITNCRLRPYQKVECLKQAGLAKITFIMSTVDLGNSWLEKKDQQIRQSVRSWLGLPQGAPVGLFHASNADGGLNIPSLVDSSISRRTVLCWKLLTDWNSNDRFMASASFSLAVKRARSLLLSPQDLHHPLPLPRLLRLQNPHFSTSSRVDWCELSKYILDLRIGETGTPKRIRIWNSSIKWHFWDTIFRAMTKHGFDLEITPASIFVPCYHLVRSGTQDHIKRNYFSKVLSSAIKCCWSNSWRDLPMCGASQRCHMLPGPDAVKPKGEFHPASSHFLRVPHSLTDREFKFALLARTECLPTNSNLSRWSHRDLSPYCSAASCRRKKDTGNHRLNSCPSKLHLYRKRHDAVLSVLSSYCTPDLQSSLCVDNGYSLLWDQSTPPAAYGALSNLRPDIQILMKLKPKRPALESKTKAAILDLKVPYHGQSFLQCHDKNVVKYQHLANRLKRQRWNDIILDTVIVSSTGLIPQHTASLIKLHLPIPVRQVNNVLKHLSITSIKQSYRLFYSSSHH